jgi:hypothetical protein
MRQVVIALFKFSELSEESKQVAIEKFSDINVDYDWWQWTYGDAENIGLKITSFDLDRKSITGELTGAGIDTANKIMSEHGKETETFKTAERYYKQLHEGIDDEISESEEEFLRDLLEDYRIILQKEYDYNTSKEAIIETIEANEYEFTEDGKIFTSTNYVDFEYKPL